MVNDLSPKHILITGASSGIGEALAKLYAKPGKTIILTGLNQRRLEDVAKACEERGAVTFAKILDVTDHDAMLVFLEDIDSKYPIDLVIANAGIGRGQKPDNWETTNRILQVDLYGVLNTVLPIIPYMKKRQHGHIAVVSSLAAYRAFPGRGAYSASKAAILAFCEDWRVQLLPFGISVCAICPGFVKTRLTDQNIHPMPFMLSVEKAAMIIANGITKKKPLIAFPCLSFLTAKLLQMLPIRLSDFIVRRMAEKGAL